MRICLLLLCTLALFAAERITITTKTVVRANAARVLGINLNYLTDGPRWSNDAGNEKLIAALRRMKPAWLRFPGGEKADSHAFAAPPYSKASPQLLRQGPGEWPAMDHRFTDEEGAWIAGREPMSFDEFIYVCRAVGARPLIVLPYDSAYRQATADGERPSIESLVEHAAAWVRYANIEHDYEVLHWSLGNETDYKKSKAEGNPGAAQYAQDLQRFGAAMKAVDPRIKLGAQGHGSEWFETIIPAAGDAISFLDVHHYAGYGWNDGYRRFLDTRPDMTPEVTMARKAAAKAGRALPIFLSEMGVYDWSGTWPGRNDLAHALVLAEMIGQHIQQRDVAAICYWNSRWVDNQLVSLPLGPELLRPVGIDLRPENWQQTTPEQNSGTVIRLEDNEAQGLQLRGAIGLTRDLPPGLLEAGRTYTLSARLRSEQSDAWCGIGIDLLQDGEKIASHGINGSNSARWYNKQLNFQVPERCNGARLWIWSFAGTSLRVAGCGLRLGVEPSSLDALMPNAELLASGQVLQLWGECLVGDLLRCETTGSLNAYACSDGQQMRLLIINPSAEEKPVDIVMVDKACQGQASRTVLGGKNLDDLQPGITISDTLNILDGRCSITLPGQSLTLLKCQLKLKEN